MQEHGNDLTVLIVTIVFNIYSFGLILMGCEVCERTSQTLEECSDMVEQFDWYSFPTDVQRMFPMILAFMQEPIEAKCFGTIACDRAMFKYVRIKLNF